MANIKITDLSLIADPISSDVLPIVDVSADTTNKISIEQLLKNAAAGTAALPAFAFDDDPDTGIYRTGADGLGFSTGGTGRLFIDSSGNIGVGTPSPSSPLHVYNATTDTVANFESGDASVAVNFTASDNSMQIATSSTDGLLKNNGAGSLRFFNNGIERLRIDSSGRILQGHPTVISKLRDAQTTTNTRNASHQQVGNNSGDAGKAYLAYHSSNSSFYSPHIWLGKSASDTKGTDALVTSGTDLGNILFTGNDGSKFVNAARILAEVDGTAAADDMPGRLAFFTTPSGSDVPVQRLTIKNDGNVGVGTASPSHLFQVTSSGTGSETVAAFGNANISEGLKIETNGNLDWGFNALNSRNLTFSTNQLERMRIDSSGFVGIGNWTSPGFNLDIRNVDTEDTTLRVYNSNTGSSSDTTLRSQIAGTTASNYIYFGDGDDNDVGRIRYLHSNNSMTFRTNATDALTIDSSQQVGIGTASPGQNLEINDTTAPKIRFARGTSYYWDIGHTSSDFQFESETGGVVLHMNFDGNVGIGTASPTEKLAVDGHIEIVNAEGKIGFNVGDEYDSGLAHYGLSKLNGSNPVNLSGYYGVTFGSNGAERVRVTQTGDVGIGSSAPTHRLEVENATPSDSGGIRISNLTYANNQDRPMLIMGTSGWTGAATNWNTHGWQFKIKSDNSGVGRMTIDTANSGTAIESFAVYTNGEADIAKDLTVYGLTVGRGPGALDSNTVLGYGAFASNSTGTNNTAIGKVTLDANTGGSNNVAVGAFALSTAQTADNNVAVGVSALYSTGTGYENVAVGKDALADNTTGYRNVGVGNKALANLTTGVQNAAIGRNALANTTTGNNNTALGFAALVSNVAGSSGVAIGYESQYYCNNTSTTYGNTNVSIGWRALKGSTTAADNTGTNNIAIGYESLLVNSSGANNVAVGRNSLYSNTSGNSNVAFGHEALRDNTTGDYNVAIGHRALYDATADQNVAVGTDALRYTTTGYQCTAVGHRALYSNETGFRNTAVGYTALEDVTTGSYNAVFGWAAGLEITTGSNNIAFGRQPLDHLTTGSANIALGGYALSENVTGNYGIAIGYESQRYANDTATTFTNTNTSIGYRALRGSTTPANNTGVNNTAIGYLGLTAVTSGSGNTVVGNTAGDSITTGSNNTCIGHQADASSATVNNEITLGNSSVATLRCQVQTISALSDARDKTNIQPLGAGLQFVNALNPVSFDWNMRDGAKVGVADTGFIAQELQEAQDVTGTVIPGLVYDNNPEKLEASYGKLLPTLVKAIQELSAENAELKARLEAAGI